MIGNVSTTFRSRKAFLSWRKPLYTPQVYLLRSYCTKLGSDMKGNNTLKKIKRHKSKSSIPNIISGSRCTVNFMAIYNGGINDPGINRTFVSPFKSMSNKQKCMNVYAFLHFSIHYQEFKDSSNMFIQGMLVCTAWNQEMLLMQCDM